MKAKKKYFDEECWRQKLNTTSDDSPICFVAEYIIPSDHEDYDFIAVGKGYHIYEKKEIKKIYVRLYNRFPKELWDEMRACDIFNYSAWRSFAIGKVPCAVEGED